MKKIESLAPVAMKPITVPRTSSNVTEDFLKNVSQGNFTTSGAYPKVQIPTPQADTWIKFPAMTGAWVSATPATQEQVQAQQKPVSNVADALDPVKIAKNEVNKSYGSFLKDLNTRDAELGKNIWNAFNSWDEAKDYNDLNNTLKSADLALSQMNSANASQKYDSLMSEIWGNIIKKRLVNEYLQTKWFDPTTKTLQTFQVFDTKAKTTPTPTQAPVWTAPAQTWASTSTSQSTQSSVSTSGTPAWTTSYEQGVLAIADYEARAKAENDAFMKLASKYQLDPAQIGASLAQDRDAYIRQVENDTQKNLKNYDTMMLWYRSNEQATEEILARSRDLALEAARLKNDKDVLEKEQYYNEMIRSKKIQKLRQMNQSILDQQRAMALWGAQGERFGTWSVKYFSDAVKESDMAMNSLEDSIIDSVWYKTRDLANLRKEYNNATAKIENDFATGVLASKKDSMDKINSIILSKWKTSAEARDLIYQERKKTYDKIAEMSEKAFNQYMDIGKEMRARTAEVASTALQAQQVLNEQKQFEMKLGEEQVKKMQDQLSSSITKPLKWTYNDWDLWVLKWITSLTWPALDALESAWLSVKDWWAFQNGELPPTNNQLEWARDVIKMAKELITHPWFEASVWLSSITPTIPGWDAASWLKLYKTFTDTIALSNLEKLKWPMSDKDIEFLRNTGVAVDPTVDEQYFKDKINELIQRLDEKVINKK